MSDEIKWGPALVYSKYKAQRHKTLGVLDGTCYSFDAEKGKIMYSGGSNHNAYGGTLTKEELEIIIDKKIKELESWREAVSVC